MHRSLGDAVLGADAVYVNDHPTDDRTTDICLEANHQDPMALPAWSASRWGRPPRLQPLHLCRSVLLGGEDGAVHLMNLQ